MYIIPTKGVDSPALVSQTGEKDGSDDSIEIVVNSLTVFRLACQSSTRSNLGDSRAHRLVCENDSLTASKASCSWHSLRYNLSPESCFIEDSIILDTKDKSNFLIKAQVDVVDEDNLKEGYIFWRLGGCVFLVTPNNKELPQLFDVMHAERYYPISAPPDVCNGVGCRADTFLPHDQLD